MSARLLAWDLNIVLWFQAWRSTLTTRAALFIQNLGKEELFVVLIPLIYLIIDAELGKRLIIVIALNGWLNPLVKAICHRPRPAGISPQIQPLVAKSDYGIPSARTQTATTFLALIALGANQTWITAAAIIIVAMIGASRLALGVHFLSDIIGAVLIGLGLVSAAWLIETLLLPALASVSIIAQLIVIAFGCATLFVVHPFLIEPATSAAKKSVIMLQGALLGACIGIALQNAAIPYAIPASAPMKLLRLIIGLAGVFIIQWGPDKVFAKPKSNLEGYLRFALVALWLTCGAPWVFSALGV